MFDHYEWFKKEVYRLTQIDLNYYKEKQMRRRIDTLARKNGADSYETYIEMISTDKAKFKQFINFITINVSEFYRNPDQWSFLDREVIPEILKNNTLRYGARHAQQGTSRIRLPWLFQSMFHCLV
jgi:chemotaxis protein methyltransferase CheR